MGGQMTTGRISSQWLPRVFRRINRVMVAAWRLGLGRWGGLNWWRGVVD
jgi:hypothetical protein